MPVRAAGRRYLLPRLTAPPLLSPVSGGLLAVVVLVTAAGRASTPLGMTLPAGFGGLLKPASGDGTGPAAAVLLALALLVVCWCALLHAVRQRGLGLWPVVWVGAIWTLPVLVAPPLLSLDAYSYLAQGRMLMEGLDPYQAGPVLLDDETTGRTDPMWRASPVPYGPLTLLLLRTVAAPDDLTTGILLLRAAAVLGVVGAVAAALHLAPVERRPYVLALTLLNPITLVHLVGGVHIDAVLAGVVGLCLLMVAERRLWWAWAFAATAVAIKITAAPLLVFVGLLLLRGGGRPHRAAAAAALFLAPFAVVLPVLDRPWGFLGALAVPGSAAPWYAPGTLAGAFLVGLDRLLGLPLSPETWRGAGRLLVLAVGTGLVLALLRAEHRDPAPDPRRSVRRAALALLIVPLSLPALYAWYLGAALFALAAVGTARQTRALVLLSAALSFTSLPPLYDSNAWALGATWAVVLVLFLLTHRRYRSALDEPRAATPLSARRPPVRHSAFVSVARLAGIGLLVPFGVGVVGPGASAQEAAGDSRDEGLTMRSRIVRQLKLEYPTLHIVRVPGTGPDGVVTVTLVDPGKRLCEIRLAATPTGSRHLRLPDALDGRTVRAVDEQSCPPPAAP